MAIPAETDELKQMAVYSEPALLGEALLQFVKIVTGEVNNYTAVGTNQMVVMLWGTNCIASAVTSGMQLTDEPQFGKHLKGAVNSYQTNTGVNLAYLLIYGSWSKVVLSGGDYLYHRSSLRGEFIAMLSQCSYYFSLCKPHFSSSK